MVSQGGILVTLHVDGTRLAFISCHLTAHEVRPPHFYCFHVYFLLQFNDGLLDQLPNIVIWHQRIVFFQCYQGVKHCEERNASIAEIFGGVRAGDERFDVSEQFHHVFWMGT